jgi:hypothetical protein
MFTQKIDQYTQFFISISLLFYYFVSTRFEKVFDHQKDVFVTAVLIFVPLHKIYFSQTTKIFCFDYSVLCFFPVLRQVQQIYLYLNTHTNFIFFIRNFIMFSDPCPVVLWYSKIESFCTTLFEMYLIIFTYSTNVVYIVISSTTF